MVEVLLEESCIEIVVTLDRFVSFLFVTKDEVDPLVEVFSDILALQRTPHFSQKVGWVLRPFRK